MRLLPAFLAATLWAQGPEGTPPKARASDYPIHAQAGPAELGAEYLVRSIGTGDQMFVAGEYLVVEVAVFPGRRQTIDVSAGHFSLRINGKKQALRAETPGTVAASIKYDDWEIRRRLEVSGGVGDRDVVFGAPRRSDRFPGDPRGPTRVPQPPRAPDPNSPVQKPEPMPLDEAVTRFALPEGRIQQPVSGYLYFYYKGKTKKIRKLELLYQGGDHQATLAFF
jgi:hypothetical protein